MVMRPLAPWPSPISVNTALPDDQNRGRHSGTSSGRPNVNMDKPPTAATYKTCAPHYAETLFKCMHPSGCKEGTTHELSKESSGDAQATRVREPGSWHKARSIRGSIQNARRNNWDGFCQEHWTAACARWQKPTPASVAGASVDTGGSSAGGTSSLPHSAGLRFSGAKRKGSDHPERIVKEMGLLHGMFPGVSVGKEDLSPPLAKREQRHVEADKATLLGMVKKIAGRLWKGMSTPLADGSMTVPTGRWTSNDDPYVELDRPLTRANRARGKDAGGMWKAWTTESKKEALLELIVDVTFVFVVPEVSCVGVILLNFGDGEYCGNI